MTPEQQEKLRSDGQALLAHFDSGSRRALRRAAGYDRLREAALRTEYVVLARRDGVEAPRVVETGKRLVAQERRTTLARATAATAAAGEQISAAESAVVGQLRAPTGGKLRGRPLAGVTVTWTDERKSRATGAGKSYLTRAKTDASGFFVLKAPDKEAANFFAKSKQLILEVEGGEFKVQYSHKQPLQDRSKRLRRIDIDLPASAFDPKTPGEKVPAKKIAAKTTPASKASPSKTAAEKTTAKKATAKKATAKKATAEKATATKAAAKKPATGKAPAKKAATRAPAAKKKPASGRKAAPSKAAPKKKSDS